MDLHKNYRVRALAAALLTLIAVFAARAARAAPLEVYGRLPSVEDVALSPDGSRIAFVRTTENDRMLVVLSLPDGNRIGKLLRVGRVKLRSVEWADNDHLLVVTSATGLPRGLIGRDHEWYELGVIDVTTQKIHVYPDLDKSGEAKIMNVVSGRIMVRRVDGHTVLFIPGLYVRDVTLRGLYRVDLQTGVQKLLREGNRSTLQWLVDARGEVVAEEDYDQSQQHWRMLRYRDGRLFEIASGNEPIDIPELLGFGPDPDNLLMQSMEHGVPVWRQLSLKDGTFGPAMAERNTLERPIEDRETYRMIGGVYVDDTTHYVFFNRQVQAYWNAILKAFSGEKVRFVSASSDFKKVVVRVEGQEHGFTYELVDLTTGKADILGEVYDGILRPLEVKSISYAAADGLMIPAYLTLPRDKPAKNLPLIVLPHGGPAVRDTADFDWWAQALAEQGYLVLQPNYRGSDLNVAHLLAGFGQWGRKMQTDLSDGVRYLVREGMADPARVCIAGGSYGGYAALAGVTIDPGVYRCAVSVAGISDLKRMLQDVKADRSEWSLRYWDRFLGVSGPSDPLLDSISPIKHLDAVNVPVLLIHGRDDTVVNFGQSQIMFDALKKAKKDVQLVTLKNEDHWLSRSETRLQMLQASVAFLRAHNPPD